MWPARVCGMSSTHFLVVVLPFFALAGCFAGGECPPTGSLEVTSTAQLDGPRFASVSQSTSVQFSDDSTGVFQSAGFGVSFDALGPNVAALDLAPIANAWAGARSSFSAIQGTELPSTLALDATVNDGSTGNDLFHATLACTVETQQKPKAVGGKDSLGQWTSQAFLEISCTGTDASKNTLSVTASFVYSVLSSQDMPCCGPAGSPQYTDCGI
jgi:hypothetical protein